MSKDNSKKEYSGYCYGCSYVLGDFPCQHCDLYLNDAHSENYLYKYALALDRFGNIIFGGETDLVLKAMTVFTDKELRLQKSSFKETKIYIPFTKKIAGRRREKVKTSSAIRFSKF